MKWLVLVFAVSGCTSHAAFEELLRAVPKNCHTTIDAQVSAGITGLGGSGHFQQECWPEGMAPPFPSP